MEIALYPGESKSHLDYLIDFLDSHNIRYDVGHCYFGHKIYVFLNETDIDLLSSHICRFILDFYLKESVLSKIYDEYPYFSTDDAGKVLSKLSLKISSTPIKDNISGILYDKKSLNPESYAAFNLKSIMICIYTMTDEMCEEIICFQEKQRFVSMVQMFSKLSFDKCKRADVEFSGENSCIVTLDHTSPVLLTEDELLAFLAQRAPESVTVKNPAINPYLADIVSEIFNSEKM